MSRRECPEVGAELLAAVSAALAVVKTHLSDPEPKVALRAVSELTKLLAVCARNGVELGATQEALTPGPSPSETVAKPTGGEGSEGNKPTAPQPSPASSPDEDHRERVAAKRPGEGQASGPPNPPLQVEAPQRIATKPPLTSFLGRADPVSQPQRPARPLALPD